MKVITVYKNAFRCYKENFKLFFMLSASVGFFSTAASNILGERIFQLGKKPFNLITDFLTGKTLYISPQVILMYIANFILIYLVYEFLYNLPITIILSKKTKNSSYINILKHSKCYIKNVFICVIITNFASFCFFDLNDTLLYFITGEYANPINTLIFVLDVFLIYPLSLIFFFVIGLSSISVVKNNHNALEALTYSFKIFLKHFWKNSMTLLKFVIPLLFIFIPFSNINVFYLSAPLILNLSLQLILALLSPLWLFICFTYFCFIEGR